MVTESIASASSLEQIASENATLHFLDMAEAFAAVATPERLARIVWTEEKKSRILGAITDEIYADLSEEDRGIYREVMTMAFNAHVAGNADRCQVVIDSAGMHLVCDSRTLGEASHATA